MESSDMFLKFFLNVIVLTILSICLVSIPLAISASLTAYANIQFAASQIGGNPSIPHLQAAKPILFYLKGALSLRLALGRCYVADRG